MLRSAIVPLSLFEREPRPRPERRTTPTFGAGELVVARDKSAVIGDIAADSVHRRKISAFAGYPAATMQRKRRNNPVHPSEATISLIYAEAR